jgi:hypothetical protein
MSHFRRRFNTVCSKSRRSWKAAAAKEVVTETLHALKLPESAQPDWLEKLEDEGET